MRPAISGRNPGYSATNLNRIFRRVLAWPEWPAWIAEQAKLNGKTQPVRLGLRRLLSMRFRSSSDNNQCRTISLRRSK